MLSEAENHDDSSLTQLVRGRNALKGIRRAPGSAVSHVRGSSGHENEFRSSRPEQVRTTKKHDTLGAIQSASSKSRLYSASSSAPRPAVLILVTGLMRSFRTTFQGLLHTIIQPNNHNFLIEILVSTDLSTSCSDKDFENGCCVEPLNQSSYSWAGLTGSKLLRQVLPYTVT